MADNIKVLTTAALFDGHDVSINIFRRLLQKRGAEIVHLGHNRSVREVVKAAIEEDVDAILISSYQGGHNEYFRYVVDSLKELGAGHIMIFGGGGGVILPAEIEALEKYGVERIYHASDGQKIGIDGISDDVMARIRAARAGKKNHELSEKEISDYSSESRTIIGRQITYIENLGNNLPEDIRELIQNQDQKKSTVIGVTGTGGSGKSSLIDEIIGRFLAFTNDIKIAVLAVDPSKVHNQGALLGDRIRYNQIYDERVYFRSFATRESGNEISMAVKDSVLALKARGFDLIFVETSGIGQGDSEVQKVSDKSIYVMTSEFGAPSQLEKIQMLDLADFICINKFEKRGSEDAYREVIINYIRSRGIKLSKMIALEDNELPVYGTSSNHFNNQGLNRLFVDLLNLLKSRTEKEYDIDNDAIALLHVRLEKEIGLIPHERSAYLADIAETIKKYKDNTSIQAEIAGNIESLNIAKSLVSGEEAKKEIDAQEKKLSGEIEPHLLKMLHNHEKTRDEFLADEISYSIQGKEYKIRQFNKTLSGTKIPKVMPPGYTSWRELAKFYLLENFPGLFPFTAGVFPYKRTTEDPKRQFAGEGSPENTNKRFHYLCHGEKAKRLSVAFDGITLYAEDPSIEPDIYGKIGESGVSVCTIDDMDKLLEGFDLKDEFTSVSMTINAPAPIMVAFFFMTAFKRELKKLPDHGKGLSPEAIEKFKLEVFKGLRGTVQADMLKEDQAQNTIIFSIDFAMKLIGDLQEYLSRNNIRNYYSLSISGYHIAEAGANPITQLAFTLANGFTYVEYFLSRGLKIDEFAPNLSFFFSNGMDPEYSVIGRVARRIWAIAMKYKYGANDRSQRLKYHIQTSGRSLHAQEIDFNDIRTTLQGLLAFYDNCNSLHTNSYDEAVTTPTEESVRRSMAIQQILSKEFGMLKNENPNQGSFIIEELTELTEEAVMQEFRNISRRGGVLGAMETQYQRSKIQEESMYYEYLKQSGEYPIVGVNVFLNENADSPYGHMLITRTSEEEKKRRLKTVNDFKDLHKAKSEAALKKLRETVLTKGNIFEELLNTVQYASMGQITRVLYEIGGKYRRGM